MATITKREKETLNCQECKHYNNGEGELYCLQKCEAIRKIEPLKEERIHGKCRIDGVPPHLLTGTFAEEMVYPTLASLLQECDRVGATMFLQYYLLSMTLREIATYHKTNFQQADRNIKQILAHLKKSMPIN